jgi:hypothetical protein
MEIAVLHKRIILLFRVETSSGIHPMGTVGLFSADKAEVETSGDVPPLLHTYSRHSV